MKVSLSFKQTEQDMFEFLMKQLSISIYIKQLIRNEMDKQDKSKEIKCDMFSF